MWLCEGKVVWPAAEKVHKNNDLWQIEPCDQGFSSWEEKQNYIIKWVPGIELETLTEKMMEPLAKHWKEALKNQHEVVLVWWQRWDCISDHS